MEELDDLIREQPERGWPLALTLCERLTPDEEAVALLAAGPLENLLSEHGPSFIDRVEARAATDEKLNHLLGGVWRLSMSGDVWARVQRMRRVVW